MNVLWISQFPVFGGPHNVALRLAEPLRRRGVETTVLLPDEPGTAAHRLRAGGVPVVCAPLHRIRRTRDPRVHAALALNVWPDVQRIRRIIRDRDHDLVVLTGLVNAQGASAARLEGVPIVWQLLDTATPAPLRAAHMPLVYRWSDAIMFNGRHLVDWHTHGRPVAAPTALFTGPVDTDRFCPAEPHERAAMRHELGVPPGVPLVGTVANLNPMKGIEWFIRASALIHARRPDAWFLISGASYANHAAYRRDLDREIAATGVPLERFVVRHDPPDRHYPALDVKLITSLPASEGRTTTGPEAMACGVPVVATDVGAVREVIEEGETGFVVPPLDAQALARATLKLLGDADLRARLGATGRLRALELYALEPSARTMIDCFSAARRFHAARGSAAKAMTA